MDTKTKFNGMSKKLGRVSFDRDSQPLFVPQAQPQIKEDYSEETAREIDFEVRQIIEAEYARVTGILTARLATLQEAAAILLRKETITGEELTLIRHSFRAARPVSPTAVGNGTVP